MLNAIRRFVKKEEGLAATAFRGAIQKAFETATTALS